MASHLAEDLIDLATCSPTAAARFELPDGTAYEVDPDNGPYVRNGAIVVPIIPADD